MGPQFISQDELNDFLSGLRTFGYDPNDFSVHAGARADTPLAGGSRVPRQEVYVSRNSNGFHRTYEGGHGGAWAIEALADVENGIFGSKVRQA